MSRFSSVSAIRAASGLRMVVLRKIPSPWTEAAKGIFFVKGLDCRYGAQDDEDPEDAAAVLAGDSSVPQVAFENEPLRSGWEQILVLAERLQPEPALIPADPAQRALMFGLAREICGELGLGWCRRLQMVQSALDHSQGSSVNPEAAIRLGTRYGFNPTHVREARARIVGILSLLADALGSKGYFLGDRLTALDIYWATMANLLSPLPEADLPMSSYMRKVYTCDDGEILAALTPALKDHQLRIYQRHLELPVPL